MIQDKQWLLSVGTFLPLVGVLVMLFIPKKDEVTAKGVAVNGSGKAARGTGGALRPLQSGKVNQYGALLFGAAAIGALVLVIVNI